MAERNTSEQSQDQMQDKTVSDQSLEQGKTPLQRWISARDKSEKEQSKQRGGEDRSPYRFKAEDL